MDIYATHTDFNQTDWDKWRLCFKGGRKFINEYLVKMSSREDDTDFIERRNISYPPAFAKSAIYDVSNSIFQRATDIVRLGGDSTYRWAVQGQRGGVDLHGSGMNSFIGQKVLPELLSMGEVGIFVDMPQVGDTTLLTDAHPYTYIYRVEDIRNYAYDSNGQLTTLLLRSSEQVLVDGLPVDSVEIYYLLRKVDGIDVEKYDSNGKLIKSQHLEIPEIPFVHLKLSRSLMEDIADYQIALLNLASSDLNIAKANFPFLTRQVDPRASAVFGRSEEDEDQEELQVGASFGQEYPLTAERPAFIHPPAEPMRVSMEKQAIMKDEIRQLINLAITSLQPRMASAASKSFDNLGLEAGLCYIGLELEYGENQIAKLWSSYMLDTCAVVKYPRKYSIKSEAERQSEAKALVELQGHVPSKTFQKEVAKQVVRILVGDRVDTETLQSIESEINSAKIILFDPDTLIAQAEAGFVCPATASDILGYPAGEAERAAAAHADRLARIAVAQSNQARGIADQGDPGDGDREKEISQDKDGEGKTRGEAK